MTDHHARPGPRRGARSLLAGATVAALSLLLAACGSPAANGPRRTSTTSGTSGPTSTTSGTSGATSTTSGTSGSTTTTTGAPGPSSGTSSTTSTLVPVNGNVDECPTDSLALSMGSSSGSAGAVDVAIVFKNTGTLPCYLYGYPGVSAVTGASGSQLGLAATKATQLGPPSVVTLQPGARANADLHVTDALNYPTSRCKPVTPGGFRVFPPGSTVAAFVPSDMKVCSADVTQQLAVGPVAHGASSQVNGATAVSGAS